MMTAAPPPNRFALLLERTPGAAQAWLQQTVVNSPPDQVLGRAPLQLAVWGSVAQGPDGRAAGTLAGVLYNAAQVADRWQERGMGLPVGDHVALAVAHVASMGPTGLEQLRWHGAAAALHHGRQQALVARDPQGIGWLGADDRPELLVLTSDPNLGPQALAVPPGVAVLVEPRGVQGQVLRPAAENLPFFREIPAVLRDCTLETAVHGLVLRLDAAVRAHGFVDFQQFQAVDKAFGQHSAGDLVWMSLAGTLGDVDVTPPARWQKVPDVSPAEPIAHADPQDRRERLWRAGPFADSVLRELHAKSLRSNAILRLPWLEPAVLAWLGALPRGLRLDALRRI